MAQYAWELGLLKCHVEDADAHTHTHTLTHTPHTHTHTPSAGPDALSERCDKMGAAMAGGKYRP